MASKNDTDFGDGFRVPDNAQEVQNTNMPCGQCGSPTYQDEQGRVWCVRSPICGPSVRSANGIIRSGSLEDILDAEYLSEE